MNATKEQLESLPLLDRQNFEGVLLESGESSEEEIQTDKHLFRTKGRLPENTPSKDVIFLKKIQEGETLQTVSLAFGCRVAELKRINNLIQDQDFFALKHIKVPIKRHGLLTEFLSTGNQSEASASQNSQVNENSGEEQINHVKEINISSNFKTQNKEAKNFFEKMDSDLQNIIKSTKTQLDTLEEATTSLTCRRIFPMRQKRYQSWGADCGIRWWNVVLVVFLVGLVIPLTYFLYFEFVKVS